MLLNVDFAKAFDCINWKFLDSILMQMNFGEKWRSWIKGCISSASVPVLVNGSPTTEFPMEKGLRQGDPLSLFLFIIDAEAMHVMMEESVERGIYKGSTVGSDKVNVSHLQFADDSLFFGDLSINNPTTLFKLLKCFELVSGLRINYHKS